MIKILIAGDFCPHKRIEQLVLDNKCEEIYNDFMPYLENNNINIANLECPLTNSGSPIPKIGPNLVAQEKCIEAIKHGHFNLLTLSNNHIMDQGEKGLFSTIDLCKKNNIEFFGAGTNLEDASRILYKKINNKQFAFLNFSEIEFSTADVDKPGSNPLKPVQNFYSIKQAREKADHVIVIVHGGHEGYNLPSPRMIGTYRFFIDAGAEVVIGHHQHCLSGHEKYKGGMIFYSLGNFIFDNPNNKNTDWNFGYCVKLLFNDLKLTYEIIPYKQCNEKPGLQLLNEEEKQNFEIALSELNDIICNDDLIYKEFKKLTKQRKDYYLIQFESFYSRIYYTAGYDSM